MDAKNYLNEEDQPALGLSLTFDNANNLEFLLAIAERVINNDLPIMKQQLLEYKEENQEKQDFRNTINHLEYLAEKVIPELHEDLEGIIEELIPNSSTKILIPNVIRERHRVIKSPNNPKV